MLDVALEEIEFRRNDSSFRFDGLTVRFEKSRHHLLLGKTGSGKSTLLRLISGDLRSDSGEILIGARPVTGLKPSRRPLLFAAAEHGAPGRWSVRHLLVSALRQGMLDREDRMTEFDLATRHWELEVLLDRRLRDLSSGERCRVRLAEIELLRPAVLLLERLFESASPAEIVELSDRFFRTLRAVGTTIIHEPATLAEMIWADRVVTLDEGRVAQAGTPKSLYDHPTSATTATAAGDVNLVPVTVTGNRVESIIGDWSVVESPIQGPGLAVVRPSAFSTVEPGGDSDFIFGIEEGGFCDGFWHLRGILSGGLILRVVLPGGLDIHKGKLLPLRFDPTDVTLVSGEHAPTRVDPLGAVPSRSESR